MSLVETMPETVWLRQWKAATIERKARLAGMRPKPKRDWLHVRPPEPAPQPVTVAEPAVAVHVEPAPIPETDIEPTIQWKCEDIIKIVAAKHGYSVAALKGQSRHAPLARARHEAMYLARALTQMSCPAIGRRFGMRDHTTVLNALWRMHQRWGWPDIHEIETEDAVKLLHAPVDRAG